MPRIAEGTPSSLPGSGRLRPLHNAPTLLFACAPDCPNVAARLCSPSGTSLPVRRADVADARQAFGVGIGLYATRRG